MSNTQRVHARFWAAMAERYGRRWTEQYGADASPAWRELIDKFTPDDVKNALAALPKEAKDFPPTLPQFEAILAKAAQAKKTDTTNWVRCYWRSSIVHVMCRELRESFESFERVLIENRRILGPPLLDLLNQLESSERRMGQRTDGLHELCIVTCKRVAKAFTNEGVIA